MREVLSDWRSMRLATGGISVNAGVKLSKRIWSSASTSKVTHTLLFLFGPALGDWCNRLWKCYINAEQRT